MPTYQLRFPQGSTLWTLEERLIAELWHVLLLHTEWDDASDGHFQRLTHHVHRFLNRHVKSFLVCGDLPRCHRNLTSMEWSRAPEGADDRAAANHQILLLDVDEDMDEFLNALEEIIFDDFCAHVPTAQWVRAKTQFDEGIRQAFGSYVLWNPACEGCPRCTPDKRVSPWVGHVMEDVLPSAKPARAKA